MPVERGCGPFHWSGVINGPSAKRRRGNTNFITPYSRAGGKRPAFSGSVSLDPGRRLLFCYEGFDGFIVLLSARRNARKAPCGGLRPTPIRRTVAQRLLGALGWLNLELHEQQIITMGGVRPEGERGRPHAPPNSRVSHHIYSAVCPAKRAESALRPGPYRDSTHGRTESSTLVCVVEP